MPAGIGRMTGSEIAETAKNAGVVLTALSGAAYACGYLVVRARARALGTDPGFALIDQAYVFAGFRFVLMLLVRASAGGAAAAVAARDRAFCPLARARTAFCLGDACGLVAGAATIWAYVATFGVSGVLLAPSSGWLADAALERNNYGMLMVW